MLTMKRSSVQSLRRVAIAAAMSCSSILASTVDAGAADLVVRYDQSQLIRLPRPVSDVIIGNPSIADVTVQGGNLLVVTGKTFGITNIIALDAQRNVIQDQRVVVEAEDRRTPRPAQRLAARDLHLLARHACRPSSSATIRSSSTLSPRLRSRDLSSSLPDGGGAAPAAQE